MIVDSWTENIELTGIDIGDMSGHRQDHGWANGELDVTLKAYYDMSKDSLSFEVIDAHVWLIDQDGGNCGEIENYDIPDELMNEIIYLAEIEWKKKN